MKSKSQHIHEKLFNLFTGDYDMEEIEAMEMADHVGDVIRDVDKERRKERERVNKEYRDRQAKRHRDYSRGILSRFGQMDMTTGDFCDKCGFTIEPGTRCWMEVNHDQRDPEHDVPYVIFECMTCHPDTRSLRDPVH